MLLRPTSKCGFEEMPDLRPLATQPLRGTVLGLIWIDLIHVASSVDPPEKIADDNDAAATRSEQRYAR